MQIHSMRADFLGPYISNITRAACIIIKIFFLNFFRYGICSSQEEAWNRNAKGGRLTRVGSGLDPIAGDLRAGHQQVDQGPDGVQRQKVPDHGKTFGSGKTCSF